MVSPIFSEGEASPPNALRKNQLVMNVVDGLARSKPLALWAEYPVSATTYEDGFRKITYRDLANAINGLAWWLQDQIGPGKDFETIAYMGLNDIRYSALTLACVKAGYKCLLLSPRNSVPAHVNLLEFTGCRTIVAQDPAPPYIAPVVAAHEMRVLTIPSVDDLLNKTYPHFPYEKTYEQAYRDPLLVIHTSGSTGMPKPIVWTNEFAVAWFMNFVMDAPEGHSCVTSLLSGRRLMSTMPPFHAGGLYGGFLLPIWTGGTTIHPLPGVIPTAQTIFGALKYTSFDIAGLAPPFVEQLAKDKDLLDFVSKNSDAIFFAGGDVPRSLGDIVANKITLFSIIGATETGLQPGMFRHRDAFKKCWNSIFFNPFGNLDFELVSENKYEAVIKRGKGVVLSPVFSVFPDLQEYRTKDLFEPHPTEPGMWTYSGRSDDIIVFLTGEKTNPVTMEMQIASHPDIKGSLVIGTMRHQAGLLLEPVAEESLTATQRAELIERVWPTIEKANSEAPQHARVTKSFIMFTSPNKLMERAGKGTIQRAATIKKFAEEIDALYRDANQVIGQGSSIGQPTTDIHDAGAISAFVTKSARSVLGHDQLGEEDDFLGFSMDSLKALELTRALRQGLGLPQLEIITIYANPSIAALSKAISGLASETKTSAQSSEQARLATLQDTLTKYLGQVDELVKPSPNKPNGTTMRTDQRVVLLTGSTGALGSYTLLDLIETPSVAHIYCLNRSKDSKAVQMERNKARGLPAEFASERVTFITTDTSQEKLGLDDETYAKLQASVTDIIHNAWMVNFNMPLASFEPQITGLLGLLSLAASTPSRSSIVFVSSVSAMGAYPKSPVPEAIVEDLSVTLPIGYGESKYVSERILDYAASKLPSVDVKVARVGQLSGPATRPGMWAKQEWFPSLVISSLHLGMIPASLGGGLVDWVPIDVMADTLVDFAVGEKIRELNTSGAVVFQPMNPVLTPWETVLSTIEDELTKKKPIRIVAPDEWLEGVRADADKWKPEDLEKELKVNPAVKLLDFYNKILHSPPAAESSVAKAVEASPSLRALQGIEKEWVRKWVGDWIS